MKRLITLMALVISTHVYGQEQRFTFGPSVNAGISQVLFQKTDTIPDHTITNRVNFSFQAGAFANYRFTPRFSVGVELLYWMQNGKVKDQYTYTDQSTNKVVSETDVYRANLSYVAVPLFFQYYLSDIVLLLGGQYGFRFGESGSIQATTIVDGVTTEGEKTSNDPNFENFDVGIKAGVLYRITDHFTAGVEYYNGRINLSQNNTTPFSSHNQYFYGAFRYNLIFGKRDQIYYN